MTDTSALPLAGSAILSPGEVSAFQRDGYIAIPGFLGEAAITQLRSWVTDVESWPAGEGEWLQHDEQGANGAVRTRTENFSPHHPGLDQLLTQGPLRQMAGQLLGGRAVLYKEKINYKHPGGGGFAAHQDALAYPHIPVSVSCLLAVDDATLGNGCLEFVGGQHGQLLPTDGDGCVDPDLAESLVWKPLPVPAGSLVWFHSHTPHRSGANSSDASRRALYLTYNAATLGDLRAAYYADKRSALESFQSTESGHQRVSLIGHFQGVAPR
ncbi:phytanoyl-CoA dioxygenase family protein [Corynebacterium sp. A21]|uniref:phytanoyl-CoA dioxygenase family protein n=1 Tax=Corynebacterium sp. A21 TaxID=3457318 RepID=UPI003FD4AB08